MISLKVIISLLDSSFPISQNGMISLRGYFYLTDMLPDYFQVRHELLLTRIWHFTGRELQSKMLTKAHCQSVMLYPWGLGKSSGLELEKEHHWHTQL